MVSIPLDEIVPITKWGEKQFSGYEKYQMVESGQLKVHDLISKDDPNVRYNGILVFDLFQGRFDMPLRYFPKEHPFIPKSLREQLTPEDFHTLVVERKPIDGTKYMSQQGKPYQGELCLDPVSNTIDYGYGRRRNWSEIHVQGVDDIPSIGHKPAAAPVQQGQDTENPAQGRSAGHYR